jgi:hypothetical protein
VSGRGAAERFLTDELVVDLALRPALTSLVRVGELGASRLGACVMLLQIEPAPGDLLRAEVLRRALSPARRRLLALSGRDGPRWWVLASHLDNAVLCLHRTWPAVGGDDELDLAIDQTATFAGTVQTDARQLLLVDVDQRWLVELDVQPDALTLVVHGPAPLVASLREP